ncbi:peptide/nickel transport system permease protein [Microbacterium resistens]|uniref:Peptide/nickel transport system permease protein n=1 Tax=Microbacterium resistens TaxID=156977 RepID=A0ABU1SFK8_9MICO|nr:ABC transporter permease [Microbacterium resistens]MDR6868375.1 peptide/nickel transport system permease protein [Microbacterium resistens]
MTTSTTPAERPRRIRTTEDSVLARMLRRPGTVAALVILAVIAALCVLSPLLPFDGTTSHTDQRWTGPSAAHWLGTDDLGRDYLVRVLEGGRISLFVGVAATVASMTVGVVVGLVAGYFGGFIDDLLMRLVDLLSSVPWMVLVIVASVFFRPGLWTIILIIGLLSWMDTARLVRAEALSARERTYVGYAAFVGERPLRIIVRHILPAAVPTIVVAATATVGNAMMTESALSFLGMGIQAPLASWGSLLNAAQGSLQKAPLLAVVPGLLIAVTVFCTNVVGNGLRAAVLREGGR